MDGTTRDMNQQSTTRPAKPFPWLMTVAALALAATVGTRAGMTHQQAAADGLPAESTDAATTQDGEDDLIQVGEQLTNRICASECHGWDEILVVRRTARSWRLVMVDMATRGAVATEDQLAVVRQYLTRTWGLVSVNSAPAEELSAVLGFSPKDAAAIVEHRQARGPFADAAALAKVPGLDQAVLEQQADALLFE